MLHLWITLLFYWFTCFNSIQGSNNAFYFCDLGMITRSQGSTTGMWRTKPARVMRRTTSLSSEMEMVFTIMNLKQGKSLMRKEVSFFFLSHLNMKNRRSGFYRSYRSWCVLHHIDCYALETLLSIANTLNKQHEPPWCNGKLLVLCPQTAFLVSFRVRLSKRRAKAGTQSTTNAVLVCKHRDMNEKELEAQVSVPFFFFYPRLNILVYQYHFWTLLCCWTWNYS